MDIANFLARIVPVSGNYLTIVWTSQGHGFSSRSYRAADQHAKAANFIQWLASKNCDVYFAHAAFTMGETKKDKRGDEYYYSKREQANVQLLRALVIDADVARPGDGKDPAKVFADRRAAAEWLVKFLAATQLPTPNLRVNSGYGMHWYWILEDAITPAVWQPLADAMRTAMVANNWVGDTSITIDSARILRPPGTVNMKSGTPVPVEIYPSSLRGDYPNKMIVDALQPWVVTQQATGTHGGATVHQLGPRPGYVPPGPGAALNAAAHTGISQNDKSFKLLAGKCLQVANSLAAAGKGDDYHVWTNHISLSRFCSDGDDYVHPISNGDPRYTQKETDEKVARTQKEIDAKGLGAPRCSSYDKFRPGVCPGCPWFGKLNSPVSLGVDEDELPEHHRRIMTGTRQAQIQRFEHGDKGGWRFLLWGEASNPRVDEVLDGHQLTFQYKFGTRERSVCVKDNEAGNPSVVQGVLSSYGVTCDRQQAVYIGKFIVAWINLLRQRGAQRAETLKPFGWNFADGKRAGFAMAGDYYRSDGTKEFVTGGDPKISAMHRPHGNYADWRRAASLFEGGRIDMQTLIATSFASPLIGLCGDVKGMSMNFWSTESGIGKTSAIRLGQSVWGDPRAMSSMTDTPNAVMKSLSELRTLTRFWDELRVIPAWQDRFVEMIYVIPQGREKARMQADTTLRDVGEWESFVIFTSNRSFSDLLAINNNGTDSGIMRLFELQMQKVQKNYDPAVGPIIKKLETNYGHAGRIYAEWLGENPDEAEQRLVNIMRALTFDLGMQQEERFFVSSMACILVGASIAKKLSIFNFDVGPIYDYLRQAFLVMRHNRRDYTLVGANGGLDLQELLGRFIAERADFRVRTNTLAKQGGSGVWVTADPRGQAAMIQIAEVPGVMRVSTSFLTSWLNERNLPATPVIQQIMAELGAARARSTIGGGTKYAGGNLWCLDIPLVGALASHLNPPTGGASRMAPGAAVAGSAP